MLQRIVPSRFQILKTLSTLIFFLKSLLNLRNPSKIIKPKLTHPNMADHDGGSCSGDVIDHPENRGGPMETGTEDETAIEGAEGTGAMAAGGGYG
ncbi:hypothetical protein RHMOL_Rhmol10G0200800 [Rhododendron molle]|uniref:Uncharacterized protein n=1 Tax=Rhododendron molle TaxID=49168 RepID=A0ACC0M618_RHOML|nr:hypothetical protein RHMOL_Rhmol10G0200800 [Rhododendron molle]